MYLLVRESKVEQDLIRGQMEEVKEVKDEQVLTIAVIGSAGRGNDARKFCHGLFEHMVKRVWREIERVSQTIKPPRKTIRLVSGGAAWGDHVAVALFLDGKVDQLHLHLPCEFFGYWKKFSGGSVSRRVNQLHDEFTRVSGVDSLKDLVKVVEMPGCSTFVHDGFFARNSEIARSVDCVIALTWSRTMEPSPGGTKDTWTKSKAKNKVHISLTSLANSIIRRTP